MSVFVFDGYSLNPTSGEAAFHYHFDKGLAYIERVQFATSGECDQGVLDRALFLAFILIGTSYYKTVPTREVRFANHTIDEWQAVFLNKVYQEGMSQFAFENDLTRADLAQFVASGAPKEAVPYSGSGILQLQSGGKDSLLVATLLAEKGITATPFHISSSDVYPAVLDELGVPIVARRILDHTALTKAREQGGLNGHVPVSYIVFSIALIQAILSGKNTVITSIGHEGEEPHEWVGDLPVYHQWAKTWLAEQLFAEYVRRYVSPDIRVGSPLRQYSELKIAELFAEHAWQRFGTRFSSCNLANYKQGEQTSELRWCGECPKCANSYLLFAPFVPPDQLQALFHGHDLFAKSSLTDTFKGLLGVDGVMKPFECVAEVDELRQAYHMARARGYRVLPFDVPESDFTISTLYPSQEWAQVKEL